MNPATASRSEIREYVRIDGEALAAFGRAGGNIHQMALDQQDVVEGLLDGLSSEQRNRFNKIYLEEVNATTAKLREDLIRIENPPFETVDISPQPSNVQIEPTSSKGIIVMLGFVVVVMLILYKISS
ncbi:hypothetical protein B1F77_26870 [Pseudomonas syringae]|uniref:Uncharacterized protein n=1 Tax=Pseudomonas syringae TaxID=317 RepID=A0AB37ZSQ6_PSESX|nr:hypothetical protein [Pseudomonas syringae]RXT72245.1 hypothetical protein B1F77_26870 [Pseudomonas syringae]RXT85341.1 hypothetical protein B1F72_13840 [Pseudomonas syringae]SDN47056.1 hypothetical protein SAMN05444505_108171 [Pseudomonas syringae]